MTVWDHAQILSLVSRTHVRCRLVLERPRLVAFRVLARITASIRNVPSIISQLPAAVVRITVVKPRNHSVVGLIVVQIIVMILVVLCMPAQVTSVCVDVQRVRSRFQDHVSQAIAKCTV